MTAFLFYTLKVIACSALFAVCYWYALRNGRFFHWNRFYILASVALSIVIPLLTIPLSPSYMVIPAATDYVAYFVIETSEVATVSYSPEKSSVSWTWLAFMLCLSMMIFLLVKETISFVRILRLKRCSERIRLPEAVLCYTDDASAPFTFFRTIFWKKGISLDSGEGRCMFRHELAHIRLGHSWDKALMQLVCCLFWMNPFFMLFRRELELVHEFAADSESIGDGNAEELSSLILCALYPNHYRDFTSRFFQSSIKRRIIMITKNKKSSMTMLRKMSIIPVALIAMYLFACNSESNSEVHTFDAVIEKPLFNGVSAIEGFREFVSTKIVYPVQAMENGISGRVFVEFIIEKDGSVSNGKILRGVDPLLDNEVLRVINTSPKWTPGRQNGKPARVSYQFPFTFALSDSPTRVAAAGAENNIVPESRSVASNVEEVLFALVDEKPLFNEEDAEIAFRNWVAARVVYPVQAMENNISGRVFLEFTIDENGSLINTNVLRGVDPLLDNELLRVIKTSPKWTPGKHNGKPVKVKYQFPFRFALGD